MIRILSVIALLAFAAPGAAQDTDAIEETIAAQLEAFNDRDVMAAWGHASPMIQGMFGTPGNFGMMVEQGYPMVWTTEAPEFIGLRDQGGRTIQTVRLRDADGRSHVLDYEMVEMQGRWRINGVWIVPSPDVGV